MSPIVSPETWYKIYWLWWSLGLVTVGTIALGLLLWLLGPSIIARGLRKYDSWKK